jgi:3-methyladenine DNA glycosylase AlkD
MNHMTVAQIELREYASPAKAHNSMRFFKTGPGQYGEGDTFIGVTVPETRKVAKKYFKELSLPEIETILQSNIHEDRLMALEMLIMRLEHELSGVSEVFNIYWNNVKYVNNWDLVDASAEYIVGPYVSNNMTNDERKKFVDDCIANSNLWIRRIIMVSTFYQLKQGNEKLTLYVAERLLGDQEDLIHKAVGWLLRETGKRVGRKHLIDFLDKHATTMPRTALRYALEHLPSDEYQYYLKKR